MCTLTIAWQAFPEAPVVVAANRDEAIGRPSKPPSLVESDPAVFAPTDLEAGGTWMGVNEHGVFVGITNRWVDGLEGTRSRGLLVRDCLRADSAADAARVVERAVGEDEYEGFNLVVADAGWQAKGTSEPGDSPNEDDESSSAAFIEWDGRLRVRSLRPGVHVVVNVGADGEFFEPAQRPEAGPQQSEDASRLREHLKPGDDESADHWLERASDAIGDHGFGACVHEGDYGTVSAALVMLRADGTMSYEHADGPPCETSFDLSHEGSLQQAAAEDADGSL